MVADAVLHRSRFTAMSLADFSQFPLEVSSRPLHLFDYDLPAHRMFSFELDVLNHARCCVWFSNVFRLSTDADPTSRRVRLWRGGSASKVLLLREFLSSSAPSRTPGSTEMPLVPFGVEGRWPWRCFVVLPFHGRAVHQMLSLFFPAQCTRRGATGMTSLLPDSPCEIRCVWCVAFKVSLNLNKHCGESSGYWGPTRAGPTVAPSACRSPRNAGYMFLFLSSTIFSSVSRRSSFTSMGARGLGACGFALPSLKGFFVPVAHLVPWFYGEDPGSKFSVWFHASAFAFPCVALIPAGFFEHEL